MKLEWGLVKLIKLKKSTRAWEKILSGVSLKSFFTFPSQIRQKNDPSTQNRPDLKDSSASKSTSLHRNPRTPGSKMVRTCALSFVFVRMINFHQKIAFFAYAISRFGPILMDSLMLPVLRIAVYSKQD